MIVIWGSKLMGRCDVVPGLFHVSTRFGHVDYLPLIPMGSYAVLSQQGTSFRGVPIQLSLKSILLTWARAGLFIAGIVLSIVTAVMMADSRRENWIPELIMALAAWGGLIALCYMKFFTHASFSRACQIAKELELSEAGYDLIGKVYGQAIPRGFAVIPTTRSAVPAMPTKPSMNDEIAPIPVEA